MSFLVRLLAWLPVLTCPILPPTQTATRATPVAEQAMFHTANVNHSDQRLVARLAPFLQLLRVRLLVSSRFRQVYQLVPFHL
jgi:hypothetical protein